MYEHAVKKLRLEEELEARRWSRLQWTLAVLALAGIAYGAMRFIEWFLKG